MTVEQNQKQDEIPYKKLKEMGCIPNPYLEKMRLKKLTHEICEEFVATNGLKIFYRSWNLGNGALNPDKILICLHGLHSHGQKFVLLADYFAVKAFPNSIKLIAPDLRGHGLSFNSENPRGDITDFSLWIADCMEFISFIRVKHPESSIYLLAESMGAAVAVLTTIKIQTMISALILLSPAMKPFALAEISLIQRSLTYGLIGGVERPSIKDRGKGRFSTNSEAYINYQTHDPLRLEKVTPRYYYQVIKMVHQLKPVEFGNFVPSCLFYGDKDVVVDLQGMKEYIRRLGNTEKELHLIPEAFHELLTDVQAMKYHIFDKIARWMHLA